VVDQGTGAIAGCHSKSLAEKCVKTCDIIASYLFHPLASFTTFDGLKLDLDVFVDDVTIHTAKDLGFSLEPMTSYNP